MTSTIEIAPDVLEAMLERMKRVPIWDALDMQLIECARGACKVRVPRRKELDGVFECYHGGLLMTVADSTACLAAMTCAGVDAVLTTTDMNIRFLAPCLTAATASARVIKTGRTMCPVAVDLHDDDGKHIAVAQVNYIILDRMPAR